MKKKIILGGILGLAVITIVGIKLINIQSNNINSINSQADVFISNNINKFDKISEENDDRLYTIDKLDNVTFKNGKAVLDYNIANSEGKKDNYNFTLEFTKQSDGSYKLSNEEKIENKINSIKDNIEKDVEKEKEKKEKHQQSNKELGLQVELSDFAISYLNKTTPINETMKYGASFLNKIQTNSDGTIRYNLSINVTETNVYNAKLKYKVIFAFDVKKDFSNYNMVDYWAEK